MEEFIIRKLEGKAHTAHPHHREKMKSPHGHPGAPNRLQETQVPHQHPHLQRQPPPHGPARSPMHHFFFLLSGTVLVETGDKTYLVKEHSLVVIPSGQLFSIKYFENAQGYMGGFTNQFILGQHTPENPISRYDFLRIWGSPKIELSPEEYSRQIPLFNRIYEESASTSPDMEIIKAYLNAILTEADAIYRRTISKVQVQNNSICNRFLDELFNGSDESLRLTVNDYAAKLSISPNHLNKVVKGSTGKSPSTWIEEAIILKAKMLLKCTNLHLSEVAAKVGIMDQSYFARKFKQHEGITPSEYRQQQKGTTIKDKND